jgi:hypothetical protein
VLLARAPAAAAAAAAALAAVLAAAGLEEVWREALVAGPGTLVEGCLEAPASVGEVEVAAAGEAAAVVMGVAEGAKVAAAAAMGAVVGAEVAAAMGRRAAVECLGASLAAWAAARRWHLSRCPPALLAAASWACSAHCSGRCHRRCPGRLRAAHPTSDQEVRGPRLQLCQAHQQHPNHNCKQATPREGAHMRSQAGSSCRARALSTRGATGLAGNWTFRRTGARPQ